MQCISEHAADTQQELKTDWSNLLFQQRADEPPTSGHSLSSSSVSAHCVLSTLLPAERTASHKTQSVPLKEFRTECV